MSGILAFCGAVVPVGYALLAIFAHFTRKPGRAQRAAEFTMLVGVVAALGSIVSVATSGPATTAILGIGGWGLQLRFDALTVTFLGLIAFVATVVTRYCRRYLAGDPRHDAFIRDLAITLTGVASFVVAGNLGQLVASWLLTSAGLHRLLVFFGDRPRARLAARKKFVIARVGDAFLIVAVVALAQAFSTATIHEIGAAARSGSVTADGLVQLAAVALAIAACLKSAQFPTHGWLLDVMETPTPVSSLLHAGLVNAGGVLLVRFADVVLLSTPAMVLLTTVGAVTAVFGCTVMMAQHRVKTALAYSTVGQMGFMLLQCGLAAFPAATLHLVAHSLYKAHAFLSSGSQVPRELSLTPTPSPPSFPRLVLGVGMAAIIFVAVGAGLGFSLAREPGLFVLGAVGVVGFGYAGARVVSRGLPLFPIVALGVMLCTLYFGLQQGAIALYEAALPPVSSLPTPVMIAGGLALAGFGVAGVLPIVLVRRDRWVERLYVALKNGAYVDALFDRLMTRRGSPERTMP